MRIVGLHFFLASLFALASCSSSDDVAIDAAAQDASSRVDANSSAIDAGTADATLPDICIDNSFGTCGDPNTSCECCAAGGPAINCLCTTTCTQDEECTDPQRPHCNQMEEGVAGFCTAEAFVCCWFCD